jgi:hypothetical protein
MKILGRVLAWLVLLPMIGWGTLAIYYSCLPEGARYIAAFGFAPGCLAILIFVRPWRRAALIVLGVFVLLLAGWFAMPPSNARDWQADVAVLPYATLKGDTVTVHNIRNCDYRTETDFTVRHYDRTVNLSKLRSADLFLSDWGLKTIVHTILSFGFEDGTYISISIETRKEKGEEYSSLKGFFRQYELFYVVADERDVIRLRTNYRKGETVYLYRLTGASVDLIRKVFLDYMRYINHLKDEPEWYNALTANCTTQIRGHTRPYTRSTRWDWRIIANGYIDRLGYEQGSLDRSLPFEELKAKSVINAKAAAADQDPAFSERIRAGLPAMDP